MEPDCNNVSAQCVITPSQCLTSSSLISTAGAEPRHRGSSSPTQVSSKLLLRWDNIMMAWHYHMINVMMIWHYDDKKMTWSKSWWHDDVIMLRWWWHDDVLMTWHAWWHNAGVRYTDQRLTSEQFLAVKEKLPFGQLPVAKINGQVVYQSMAIAR